ncbi:MAG: Ig-like domain-containing protein [Chloroflexota bacterium]
MTAISRIHPFAREHGSVFMHQGYLVQVYSQKPPATMGGFSFYDISDPYNPVLVANHQNDRTMGISEQHASGYYRHEGRDYVALLANGGAQIWDWTDIHNPQRLSVIDLPDVSSGYSRGAWWLFWQMPILYIGAASNGLYIVDTTDLYNPSVVQRQDDAPNPMPNTLTGGFRMGPVFAVGNLLVTSSNAERGYATFDISDPRNPSMLATFEGRPPNSYSTMFNGHKLYGAGTDDELLIFDLTEPTDIVLERRISTYGNGGYLTIQDGYAHLGASRYYAKVDVLEDGVGSDRYLMERRFYAPIDDVDHDFVVVLGNLAVVSDDHGHGSFITPHQAKPDTTPPIVNMILPADDATEQARSTRIGLTFSDQLDPRAIGPDTIIVRPLGSADALEGYYSIQTGIVNFAPRTPLEANTTYEVLISSGGVKDVAGNAIAGEFHAIFSTGSFLNPPITCSINPIPAVAVGEPIQLEAKVGSYLPYPIGEIEYVWDFNDGSALTRPWAVPTIDHFYETPGHYNIKLKASASEYTAGCATQVTVHYPVDPVPAPSSTTILFDEKQIAVWKVNPDHDSVTSINAITFETRFEQPVGAYPRTLALAGDGTVWVVNQADATISILNGETGNIDMTLALPHASQPFGIIFSPDKRYAFVSLQATGQVVKIDANARRITDMLTVGPQPRGLTISKDGQQLFVTRFISPSEYGEVIVVDTGISSGGVRRLDALSLAVDAGPDTERSGRGVPNALESPAISPDGRRLWIPSKKDNTKRGHFQDGHGLTFESTVRPILSQVDVSGGRSSYQEVVGDRYDLNDRSQPVAMGFSPIGDYAFVVLQGSNAIDVIDAYSGRVVTAIENIGHAPQGLAFTSDGGKLFVDSYLSRSIYVYDVRDIVVEGGDLTANLVKILPTIQKESLDSEVLEGKRIFYNAIDPRMSRDGYISCNVCHLDGGGEDGRVWDRGDQGEGLRNTIDLRHQGYDQYASDTAMRLHWSGNYDEFQDFEHDMRTMFGGQGFLTNADFEAGTRQQPLGERKTGISKELDALAVYVRTLAQGNTQSTLISPHRNPDRTLTTDGEAGRAHFLALGCATCHHGPDFSDGYHGLQHNVGTIKSTSGQGNYQQLQGFDTPSLRGLWQSAPYLHDGSAQTLVNVLITENGQGRHGSLASSRQNLQVIEQLVSYLLQIDVLEPAIAHQMPSVNLVAPQPLQRFRAGSTVRVSVDTLTSLNPIEKVVFFANGVPIGEDNKPMYQFQWRNVPVGTQRLQAQLTYENGTTTLSNEVIISVD